MNSKESFFNQGYFHGLETAPTTMICDIDESKQRSACGGETDQL